VVFFHWVGSQVAGSLSEFQRVRADRRRTKNPKKKEKKTRKKKKN
jgi:hypothetical protein